MRRYYAFYRARVTSSSVIISYHQSSSVIICHHQSSSAIISHHQSSSIIINHHQSSSVIISRHHQLIRQKNQKPLFEKSRQTSQDMFGFHYQSHFPWDVCLNSSKSGMFFFAYFFVFENLKNVENSQQIVKHVFRSRRAASTLPPLPRPPPGGV